MKIFFKVTKGRRVKEYADEIKEAAVRYGYKYGWTAAAIKYGTSSTSVSRWATYDDPKSPWKLKVKKCFFLISFELPCLCSFACSFWPSSL